MNPIYTIHTDGSCLKNPGGYGGIGVIIAADGFYREIGEGFPAPTTNNQMEIMAAIRGLESLPESGHVELISDSEYLINTMTKGWKRKKNLDIWVRLDAAAARHRVTWKWVRGHNGNSINERCDELAKEAARAEQLQNHPFKKHSSSPNSKRTRRTRTRRRANSLHPIRAEQLRLF
jgi:ribonuclease HI